MSSTDTHFTFQISDPNETDLVIVSVKDSRTGFIVRTPLPNNGVQTASIMAFAGARYSRSDLSAHDLFKEIKASGKNANEKLANIFRKYGHSSVADMAQLFAYIENVPKIYATKFFYETSVGGGQERSSRYQDYSLSQTIPLGRYVNPADVDPDTFLQLGEKFQKLQEHAIEQYRNYKERLTQRYTQIHNIDTQNKQQLTSLQARVYDSARYFLPHGVSTRTSLAWITSAREWARIISLFKSSHEQELVCLGEQLEVLFAPNEEFAQQIGYTPEAPDLIRYTEADETTDNNLFALKRYLESETNFLQTFQAAQIQRFVPVHSLLLNDQVLTGIKMSLQNILSIYPHVDEVWLINWLMQLPLEQKEKLGEIVVSGFNHHKQMGNQFRVNTYSFLLYTSACEGLDLNRHRAWGRFIPMLSTSQYPEQYLNHGYTLPAYLYMDERLADIREDFERDLQKQYQLLSEFVEYASNFSWFPKHLFIHLLPMGSIMKMWMHASPKEISYMTKLRVRPGGHINYRISVWEMARKASNSDPFLKGLDIGDDLKPDPTSSEQFLDRS
jgi:thymidylate synthase ThyX